MAKKELFKERKRLWCGLPWTFTVYTLLEDKMLIDSGFLNKKQDEVRLYRILDLSLSRSFIQRIFGIGTIHCVSADKTMKDFDIKNIKNSENLKEILSETVEKARKENRVSSREFMSDVDDFDDEEI